jgi:DNA repair protein RadC
MKNTNDIAHKMIKEFGTLAGLFEADPKDISRRCGVSENIAILVSLIPSFSKRYFKGKLGEKPVLNSTAKAGEYAITLFTGI